MGLFGDLFKSKTAKKKEQPERAQDAFEQQLKALRSVRNPSPTLVAITNLIAAGHNRDDNEWKAAMSQTIECPDCHHKFVMFQGWNADQERGALQCPRCKKFMYAQVYAPD
jgi:DNA-directed RNA polymerase subunit RPC12/RpoP